MDQCCYRTSVKALVLDEEGRFLLAREECGKWALPGGGIDHDELPHACLERELMEELGIAPSEIAQSPSYFYTCRAENGKPFSNVVYRVQLEHLDFTPSDECQELRFFTVEEAQKVSTSPMEQRFMEQFHPEHFL